MLWILGFWLLSLLGVSVLLSLLFIEASKDNTKNTALLNDHLIELNKKSIDT